MEAVRELLSIGRELRHENGARGEIVDVDFETSIIKIKFNRNIFRENPTRMPISELGKKLFFENDQNGDSEFYPLFFKRYKKYQREIGCDPEIKELKSLFQKRGVISLYHFTRIENIRSIAEFGLLPVNIQKKRGVESILGDKENRYINYISLSISFPNYLMFNSKIYKSEQATWAIIELDVSLLYEAKGEFFAFETNAASKRYANVKWSEVSGLAAFKQLFASTVTWGSRVIYRDELKIEDNETTNPQAEILYGGCIDAKYIKKICIAKTSDFDEYMRLNSNDFIASKLCVDPKYFWPRADYRFWTKE